MDVDASLLTRYGQRVKMQEQPFRLLVLLIESNGEIVSREQICNRLWPANTYVSFDKSLAVAVLKIREALGDNAAAPIFIETIPRRGYRFIAPVSIRHDQPSEEHGAISERSKRPPVADAPDAEWHPTAPSTLQSSPVNPAATAHPLRLRLAILGMAALFGLVIAGVVMHRQMSHSKPTFSVSEEPLSDANDVRRSVAVLGFQNLSPQSREAWLSSAFSEMLNTELASDTGVRMISAEDVAAARREEIFESASTLSRSTLSTLHRRLGADLVVLGSYTLLPGTDGTRIRFDVRVQDATTGETVSESAFTGVETQLFDLANEAGNRIRETLTPSSSLETSADGERISVPANQLALELYTEGRQKLYAFDFVGARDLLKRAVTADPSYAPAHSALSETFWHLGYQKLARDEAKRGFDSSRSLQPEPRLLIEGEYREMLNDWPAAIETYRKLWRLSPEQLEYGLRLAAAQLHESSIDALHTIAALRTLPPPQGNDPRIDLLEASVLTDQDLVAARAAAERAISKASASRSTLMMARGYGILCEQDAGLGTEMQRSVEECEQARTSYMDAGDRNNAARTLNDMAGIYYSHGDLPHAEQLWKEALIEFGTVDDVQGIAASSSNLGEALLTRGNLHAARALFKKARQGYAAISDQDGLASVFVDLGSVAFEAGDMRAAKSDFQRASELALQNGDKSVAADGMHGTGDVLVEAADFEGARNSYRRALELREQVGQKQTSAESRLALARVGLLSGHAAEVETSIRDCREQFHAEHQIDDELSAGLLLVRDLLQLKRGPEAQQEFVLLQPLRSITQNRFLQLRFAIEEGRLLADRAHNAEAAAKLQSASKEAAVGGFQELQMEASLLRTQMAGVGSHHQRAGQQMALLRAQQIQNGYLLLANSILPEK